MRSGLLPVGPVNNDLVVTFHSDYMAQYLSLNQSFSKSFQNISWCEMDYTYLIDNYSVTNKESILLPFTVFGLWVCEVWETEIYIVHLSLLGCWSRLWSNQKWRFTELNTHAKPGGRRQLSLKAHHQISSWYSSNLIYISFSEICSELLIKFWLTQLPWLTYQPNLLAYSLHACILHRTHQIILPHPGKK